MPFYLLLAMQAAGMVTDFIGNQNQARMMGMGDKVEQAGIESNIYQARLEAQDNSLQAMKNLRQTLGSQIATFAARGTNPGEGNAAGIINQSVGNFNEDERMRRMNLLGRENQLRAGSAMSRLQSQSDVSNLWKSFSARTINRFPSSVAGWKQAISDTREGFGLTPIK